MTVRPSEPRFVDASGVEVEAGDQCDARRGGVWQPVRWGIESRPWIGTTPEWSGRNEIAFEVPPRAEKAEGG